jgi:hypothetical protein
MRKSGELLTALLNERFEPAFLERAESTGGLFSSWTQAAVEDAAYIEAKKRLEASIRKRNHLR